MNLLLSVLIGVPPFLNLLDNHLIYKNDIWKLVTMYTHTHRTSLLNRRRPSKMEERYNSTQFDTEKLPILDTYARVHKRVTIVHHTRIHLNYYQYLQMVIYKQCIHCTLYIVLYYTLYTQQQS